MDSEPLIKLSHAVRIVVILIKQCPTAVTEQNLREWFDGLNLVSLSQVANVFGVSYTTVKTSWRTGGMPGSGKKFNVAEILMWFCNREKTNSESKIVDEFTTRKRSAETRAAEADAILKERRAEVVAGHWIRLAIAVSYTKSAASVLRDGLMRISQKLRPSYPPKFRDQMCDDLDNEIRNLLVAFSEGSTHDLRAAAEIGDIDDARY